MKTTIELLREKLGKEYDLITKQDDLYYYLGYKQGLAHARNIAKELLETEKQQIIDSYNDGILAGEEAGFSKYDSEEYYKLTYTTEK